MNIYTITPSWLIKNKKEFIAGIKNLEKLGFRVLNRKFINKLPSAKEKANQIHRAYLDKSAGMVLAQRGGYSSMKILPYIKYGLIKRNPKIFAGFSDITTLLNSIYEKTGQVTLHSPMVWNFSNPSKFTLSSFKNALKGFPDRQLFRNSPITVYVKGKADGILKGGNLVTLSALIGTEWDLRTEGCIIFLEDVDEKPHEVDRYLTQWILSGKLKSIKGLILGDFRGVNNRQVFKVITEQMNVKFPVVHCPFIGHVKNKITLPVGALVELDTGKKSLVLLEKIKM